MFWFSFLFLSFFCNEWLCSREIYYRISFPVSNFGKDRKTLLKIKVINRVRKKPNPHKAFTRANSCQFHVQDIDTYKCLVNLKPLSHWIKWVLTKIITRFHRNMRLTPIPNSILLSIPKCNPLIHLNLHPHSLHLAAKMEKSIRATAHGPVLIGTS